MPNTSAQHTWRAEDLVSLANGLPLEPLPAAPPQPAGRYHDAATWPHAPVRPLNLSGAEECQALRNALRYFPQSLHAQLAPEFAAELRRFGHIYMYRFQPAFRLSAPPVAQLPAHSTQAAAIMLMILNNLDPAVAQFPDELVTYGGNGQVFSNWAQFWLVMGYLARMTDEQTLVMYSGHPMGLFPSHSNAPRCIISNGMVVPNYSSREDLDRMFALGVSQYGQMTAGSYCYIGPQGIVHGTTLTLLNAGRRCFKEIDSATGLRGRVFLSSGLGGMSGAQAKAAVISGYVGVIAEISREALEKRHAQGWLCEIVDDLEQLVVRIRSCRAARVATSLGFHGNIVDVWERLAEEHRRTGELLVEVGSDQSSCHNPFQGGYYPVGVTYDEAQVLMRSEPARFQEMIHASLRRQVAAINYLAEQGLYFFDYGNAFLLEARRAGAAVGAVDAPEGDALRFRYASYVQDIMGDIFSLGFGPFRWVCLSGLPADLAVTDRLAGQVLRRLMAEPSLPSNVQVQYQDNLQWIEAAEEHRMVVGSQARILYSDQAGRMALAEAFNAAVASGQLAGPVVLSRDHHDVSGTDSPFRETSNIQDGSAFTADMAVQNCIGDAVRGATWVALHNGGGVGWGEVINGGFGLLLDGSDDAAKRAAGLLAWDVSNGVARRAWAGNERAQATIARTAKASGEQLTVTVANAVQSEELLLAALAEAPASEVISK